MTPTWASINELARFHLGDTEVAGGQRFTDAKLAEANKKAWADMFRALNRYGVAYVNAESFVALPANTSYVNLAAAGINGASSIYRVDIKHPEVITTVPLIPALSTDPATGWVRIQPYDLTGFTTGDWVEVILDVRTNGVINDVWTVTVDSPYLILNGCVATIKDPSEYAGAAEGYVSKGGQWRQLRGPLQEFGPMDRSTAQGMPTECYIRKNALRVSPSSDDNHVLSVQYRLTGDWTFSSPDSPVMMDDCESLLGSAVAGIAAKAAGQPGWQDMLADAYGPSLEPTGDGGALGGMVDQYIKQMQMDPQVKTRFRMKNYGRRLGGNYFSYWNVR